MTLKHFARTAGYATLSLIFPTPTVKKREDEFDVEAHIAKIQAAFADSVKDDLKPQNKS